MGHALRQQQHILVVRGFTFPPVAWLLCPRTLTATLGLPFSFAFVRTHLGARSEPLFHFRLRDLDAGY